MKRTSQALRINPSLSQSFLDFVGDKAFPCVGVKTAISLDQLFFYEARDMREPDDDRNILEAVRRFVADYEASPSLYRSLVVLFEGPQELSEIEFERALWSRLQSWHALDREDYAWDPSVSSNPADKSFSFSLAGRAFYVVGMHPQSSRPARRSPFPALALNLHDQFERLRENDEYAQMQRVVRRRDLALSGSINPMLADFNAGSEAAQYSGRKVDGSWKCPFSSFH